MNFKVNNLVQIKTIKRINRLIVISQFINFYQLKRSLNALLNFTLGDLHSGIAIFSPVLGLTPSLADFSLISKLTLISDYMLLLAAFCYLLLFTLSFSKLYNNSNPERNFKFLLATGLGSASLCFTIAIPHIVFNLLNGFNYLHTSIFSNITLLFLGIFIIVFLISYFSRKNHSN